VRVTLSNSKGENFEGLVKTDLLHNVGCDAHNAPWGLGSEVVEVAHIEKQ
jgi:hypothetical protein